MNEPIESEEMVTITKKEYDSLKRVNHMKCVHCDGTYEEKMVEDEIAVLSDGTEVHVPNVSLLECNTCKDLLYPPEAMEKIENRIREVRPHYYDKSDAMLATSKKIRVIEEQNKSLKLLLKSIATILPRHSDNCASYADKYCNCSMKEIRSEIEGFLNE